MGEDDLEEHVSAQSAAPGSVADGCDQMTRAKET